MKLFFAGVTHAGQYHVREQIHMTLKTPLYPNFLMSMSYGIFSNEIEFTGFIAFKPEVHCDAFGNKA
jgi:hypothetical protein